MEDTTVPPPLLEDAGESKLRSPFLVVMIGPDMGQSHRLESPETIVGRDPTADMTIEAEGVSRAHAKLVLESSGEVTIVDLGSTNGTWVEGVRTEKQLLAGGDRIHLGSEALLKFRYQDPFEELLHKKLYASATRDSLTAAFNRRFFDEQLAREISHSRRHNVPLSLLAFDIDRFKLVNEKFGRPGGDEALQCFCRFVADSIRLEDMFFRIGGNKFALIMRKAGADNAEMMAERMRGLISENGFALAEDSVRLTASLGFATFDKQRHPTPTRLLAAAQAALDESKSKGGNRVSPAKP